MTIELEVRDRVAWLTLSRPFAMNAFDEAQIETFAERLAALEAEPDLHAVIVTGAGRAFSVGLDLDLLGRGFDDPAWFRARLDAFGEALTRFERLPVPTIAAVNGLARAGGFELLLCCDLVLVATSARIGDTHLEAGLPPGGGASARLPRRIGRQAARDLLLTGRWVDADEAVRLGLASRAVPLDMLTRTAETLAAEFASRSRPALVATKTLLRDQESLPLDEALTLELGRFEDFVRTEPSASDAYRAYVEGRRPAPETR